MNALKHLVLIAVAGICIAVTALKMAAQVSVEVGSLLNVPMVTTTRRLMAALPTAITARNVLRVVSSLALGRGFMARTTSRAK